MTLEDLKEENEKLRNLLFLLDKSVQHISFLNPITTKQIEEFNKWIKEKMYVESTRVIKE